MEITELSSSSEPSKKSETGSVRSEHKEDSDAETEQTVMSTGAGRTSDIEEEFEEDVASLTPPAIPELSHATEFSPATELPEVPLLIEKVPPFSSVVEEVPMPEETGKIEEVSEAVAPLQQNVCSEA